MQLPGVGEATAERIIAERTKQPFTTPDDLLRVQGIGKKKLEQLRPYVRTQ
jgi:DNA uptake protein ComE-like DNA-binding protein